MARLLISVVLLGFLSKPACCQDNNIDRGADVPMQISKARGKLRLDDLQTSIDDFIANHEKQIDVAKQSVAYLKKFKESLAEKRALANKITPVVYRTEHLPVWNKKGEWDPVALIQLIQLASGPKNWESDGGSSTVAPYLHNKSLIISTTSKNHDVIAELLERLRKNQLAN